MLQNLQIMKTNQHRICNGGCGVVMLNNDRSIGYPMSIHNDYSAKAMFKNPLTSKLSTLLLKTIAPFLVPSMQKNSKDLRTQSQKSLPHPLKEFLPFAKLPTSTPSLEFSTSATMPATKVTNPPDSHQKKNLESKKGNGNEKSSPCSNDPDSCIPICVSEVQACPPISGWRPASEKSSKSKVFFIFFSFNAI